jgi:transposase
MEALIKLLDKTLKYLDHSIEGDTIFITVQSEKKGLECPFCGKYSKKVHSLYSRSFQDLPLQDRKVIIKIKNRKFFCLNSDCAHFTFAEYFNFVRKKGKKTKRLEEEIVKQSLDRSLISASKQFNRSLVKISKSTIFNLLKNSNNRN